MFRSQFLNDSQSSNSVISIDSEALKQSLEDHIASAGFPCVGAKSALANSALHVVPAWSLSSAWDDVRIHREILAWSDDYREHPPGLRSLAVVFEGPTTLSEQNFEKAMWERIQSFADKDEWLGQRYDPSVSSDPTDPHFSLSFGGKAYFVVGLHPQASRPARRTKYPTLVFNLHEQFVSLRETNRYERMRERIIARDVALAGAPNPMLARHGEQSEARQYSGRKVDSDWQCPFRDPRT